MLSCIHVCCSGGLTDIDLYCSLSVQYSRHVLGHREIKITFGFFSGIYYIIVQYIYESRNTKTKQLKHEKQVIYDIKNPESKLHVINILVLIYVELLPFLLIEISH